MKVLIFDTETGGLHPQEHSVLSVGALAGDLDTGEILDTFESYHKLDSLDDYVVTPGAIEVHGITAEKAFSEGKPSEEIQDQFADLHTEHNCVHVGGHNVQYDVEMMAYGVFRITPTEFRANFGYRMLDTLPLVRLTSGLEEVKSGATLTQVCKVLGIDMTDYGGDKFHAALFDSVCTFRIMCRYREVFTNADVVKLLQR